MFPPSKRLRWPGKRAHFGAALGKRFLHSASTMSAPHQSRLFNWLVRRWVCTFLLMGVGFVVFGVLSLNLVQVFAANVRFLGEHGWDAIKEGGARQLLELIASVFGAIAFYLVFKTCEHALVERIAHYKTEKSSN